jgi:hypothetical protein
MMRMQKHNSLFSLFLLFLSQLETILNATTHYNIISIRSNAVSSYASQLLGGKTFSQSASVDSQVSTDIIVGDVDSDISADIVKYNGDIGTDVLSFENIFRNGEYMSKSDYYVNYTYSNSKYYSNPQMSTYNFDKKDYAVGCRYRSNDIQASSFYPSLTPVLAAVSYSFATFALLPDQQGLFLLKFDKILTTTQIIDTIEDLSENFNQTSFKNLWVIEQEYNSYSTLVLQEAVSKDLIFLNLTITSSRSDSKDTSIVYNMRLKFYNKIKYLDFNSSEINKIGVYEDTYLLATNDKGLISIMPNVYDSASKVLSWKFRGLYSVAVDENNRTRTPSVGDFVVNQKTIYLIDKSQGLVILDIFDSLRYYSLAFYHPKLLKLDFFANAFTGSKFLGISVNNGDNIFEFFFEFLIDDEYNPLLNKVYTTDEIVLYDNFLTVDKFFTYFFNKISNKLMIIRRGMINSISSETYYVDLSRTIKSSGLTVDENPMIRMYDYSTDKFFPAILSKTYFLFLNAIDMPYDTLTCKFNQGGFYNISMILRGEVCAGSMDSSYQYTSCNKMINITYYVYGDASMENIGIIIGLVCVCGGVLFGLIFFILYKSHCCSNWDAFKVESDENTAREVLYREALGGLGSNVNDPVASEFQLGTEVNGKVLGEVLCSDPSEKNQKLQNNAEKDNYKKNANNVDNVMLNTANTNLIGTQPYSVNRTVVKKKSTKNYNTNNINNNNNVTDQNSGLNIIGENIIVNKKEQIEQPEHKLSGEDLNNLKSDINKELDDLHDLHDEMHNVEFKPVELTHEDNDVKHIEKNENQVKNPGENKPETTIHQPLKSDVVEAVQDIEDDQEKLKPQNI